ncbi:MAG TPA: ATPase, partial [Bacteroidetes bacterium]|nr:ATPase [Bacteroidota bacterium]
MINRKIYIEQITDFIDKPFVKVISGIRRCGKSVLLMQLIEVLKQKGVNEKNIIYINFESFRYAEITNAKQLYEKIASEIVNNDKYYILLDEIQEVDKWEKAINSFRVDFNADIYITGSNSHLLSSELATYLSGRYIQIPVYTLSFSEFLDFRKEYVNKKAQDVYVEFENYLRLGGFPSIHAGSYTHE